MTHFFIRVLMQSNGMAHPKTTVLVKMLLQQWKSDNPTVIPAKLDETVKLFI
jgi:hypothetical protein